MWEEFGVGKHWQFWQTECYSLMFYPPILSFIAMYTHNSFICILPSKWFGIAHSLMFLPTNIFLRTVFSRASYIIMVNNVHVPCHNILIHVLKLLVNHYWRWWIFTLIMKQTISNYPLHYKSTKTVGDKVHKTRQQLNTCVDIYICTLPELMQFLSVHSSGGWCGSSSCTSSMTIF